jgi:hypothetical protein
MFAVAVAAVVGIIAAVVVDGFEVGRAMHFLQAMPFYCAVVQRPLSASHHRKQTFPAFLCALHCLAFPFAAVPLL